MPRLLGQKFEIYTSGKIVALGSMMRQPAVFALFLHGNTTNQAVASGLNWSYDSANRYRYVTLSTPRSITASAQSPQSIWVMVKSYSGGYSSQRSGYTPFPLNQTTTSGNIKLVQAGLKYVGRGSNNYSSQIGLCQYPTSFTSTYLYGNTDFIFLPD